MEIIMSSTLISTIAPIPNFLRTSFVLDRQEELRSWGMDSSLGLIVTNRFAHLAGGVLLGLSMIPAIVATVLRIILLLPSVLVSAIIGAAVNGTAGVKIMVGCNLTGLGNDLRSVCLCRKPKEEVKPPKEEFKPPKEEFELQEMSQSSTHPTADSRLGGGMYIIEEEGERTARAAIVRLNQPDFTLSS